jgi:uncharacterized protein (TIGR00369 family)
MFAGELPLPADRRDHRLRAIEMARPRGVPGPPLLRHYNPLGTVHGGWIATLLDSCVGCAVHHSLAAGKAYTTAELKVNYVRAVTDRVRPVARDRQRDPRRRPHGHRRGRLVGPDGKLYAHASTTCFIFDAS